MMIALGGAGVAGCSPDSLPFFSGREFYNKDEFRLIEVLADAIIPETDTPGAIGAGVPNYIDAMMKSWASAETKTTHRQALREISAKLEELGGDRLERLSPEARVQAVSRLDAEAYAEGEPPGWLAVWQRGAPMPTEGEVGVKYRWLKSFIALVYYSTEIGATQELQFELVPGRWESDAPLSEIGRTWAE
jgi:hypothetical protein